MDIQLSAKDVFALAREIERRAGDFYMQAAGAAGDAITNKLFLDLALMEKLHSQIFDGMQLVPEVAAGTTGPIVENQQAGGASHSPEEFWPMLAGNMIEDLQHELPSFFNGRRTSEEILRAAMDFERDTIVLFLGLREMMSETPDKHRLDEIMKEEMGHLIQLGSQLARLGAT